MNDTLVYIRVFGNLTISPHNMATVMDSCILDEIINLYELCYKGNNKITELRTILQRESPNS
jgi:hypothetical protein